MTSPLDVDCGAMADVSDDTSHHHVVAHRRRRGRPRIALNLTAMIDVTFLLLVYFIVATRFKVGEEIYRMDLPRDLPGQQQRDPFQLDEQPLRVRIASQGTAYVLRVDGPYRDKPGSFDELVTWLRERQVSTISTGGLFQTDHPIVIEPTRQASWQHVMQTFNAVARAKYTNIVLARPGT